MIIIIITVIIIIIFISEIKGILCVNLGYNRI